MMDSMLGGLLMRVKLEASVFTYINATDKEPAQDEDSVKESQDHQKDQTIYTLLRTPLQTGAPHPHLTHSTANTTPTEIISVMEIEYAHQEGAKEPQDDLHPTKSISF